MGTTVWRDGKLLWLKLTKIQMKKGMYNKKETIIFLLLYRACPCKASSSLLNSTPIRECQFTVRVSVKVCVKFPEVPFTVTV